MHDIKFWPLSFFFILLYFIFYFGSIVTHFGIMLNFGCQHIESERQREEVEREISSQIEIRNINESVYCKKLEALRGYRMSGKTKSC